MSIKLPEIALGKSEGPSDTTILETRDEAIASAPTSVASTDGQTDASGNLRGLTFLLVLLVAVTVALLFLENRESERQTAYASASGEMRTLSQQIAKASQLALRGESTGFAELSEASQRFDSLLSVLSGGGTMDGQDVPASPDSVRPALATLSDTWAGKKRDVDQLLSQRSNLVSLNQAVATINERNATLLDLAEQVANLKLLTGAPAAEIVTANRAVMFTQRIAKEANGLLAAELVDPEASFQLGKDANDLRDNLAALANPNDDEELRARLAELTAESEATLNAVNDILGNAQLLAQAKQAGSRTTMGAPQLLQETSELAAAYDASARGVSTHLIGAVAAVVGALIVLAMMAKRYNDDIGRRRIEIERQRAEAENDKNMTQQAILRLMNEMGDLADGDLTIRATVSEDITGAIADSVNYTIEELAVLVGRINDAASRVTSATESAQSTSTALIAATERQASELRDAGSTIEQMARNMTESSSRALQSAQVARRSLESARKGADAVQATIRGMNSIREQIQETSKRIKRLGESSQEIGEIVELISDITEQTNVLALNAAIQAASAGEAGRGFTVVAEEVQRLAERSAEATKQIAAIVKTIQTDTQDAVSAMENATHDVVKGAELSDGAGQALNEIGQVSVETARLIEQISTDTQRQAQTAESLAESMKGILHITEQTAENTQETAVSIGQLSDLAIELKGSVSGFKV